MSDPTKPNSFTFNPATGLFTPGIPFRHGNLWEEAGGGLFVLKPEIFPTEDIDVPRGLVFRCWISALLDEGKNWRGRAQPCEKHAGTYVQVAGCPEVFGLPSKLNAAEILMKKVEPVPGDVPRKTNSYQVLVSGGLVVLNSPQGTPIAVGIDAFNSIVARARRIQCAANAAVRKMLRENLENLRALSPPAAS